MKLCVRIIIGPTQFFLCRFRVTAWSPIIVISTGDPRETAFLICFNDCQSQSSVSTLCWSTRPLIYLMAKQTSNCSSFAFDFKLYISSHWLFTAKGSKNINNNRVMISCSDSCTVYENFCVVVFSAKCSKEPAAESDRRRSSSGLHVVASSSVHARHIEWLQARLWYQRWRGRRTAPVWRR